MKLKQIASNMTQVSIGDREVLFSYETPVAIQTVSGLYLITDKKWSRTTTKHINKWINNAPYKVMPQSFFDSAIALQGKVE